MMDQIVTAVLAAIAGGGIYKVLDYCLTVYKVRNTRSDEVHGRTRSEVRADRMDQVTELGELIKTLKKELEEKDDDIKLLKRDNRKLWEANGECEKHSAESFIRIQTLEYTVDFLTRLLPSGTVIPAFVSKGSGSHKPVAENPGRGE